MRATLCSSIFIDMKKKRPTTSSVRDRYTVVLEDIRSQVQGVAEGVVGVHQKLEQHDKRFETIEKKLDSHTAMIGQLMMDVAEIKHDLKQKVGRDEFARLEKRVLMIERRGR